MTRKIASRSAAVALALGALTSVALAKPVELTDAQMDWVSAGVWGYDATGTLYDVNHTAFIYHPESNSFLDPNGRGVWLAPNGIQYNADGSAVGFLSWAPMPDAPLSPLLYDGENGFFTLSSPENWSTRVGNWDAVLRLGR